MSQTLPMLNRKLLEEKLLGTKLADFSPEILDYPEKVIQFGEGNFLRGFVDWMIHKMNKKGQFQGRVVVVQPLAMGRVSNLNDQDGLYTMLLRGLKGTEIVDRREIMTSISRGLNPYSQWAEVLKCAENPAIEFVISNTTEAGITYNSEDKLSDAPPNSFPGKLTAYLYHRYQAFNGDPAKGMLIIPCELIDKNGENLKKTVLQTAANWQLPQAFSAWVNESNSFLNSLVDRIVTGYPGREAATIEQELGYTDQNLNTSELFHLWVIEGDAKFDAKLPFTQVGLNVKWVKDMTPYRTRKVRILNGTHTSAVAVACLSNIALVRDAIQDKKVGKFVREAVFEEIIPTLDMDKTESQDFAQGVLERFNNPFIDHKWTDISLNSTSKFNSRVLPSITKYLEKTGKLPKRLIFSLAALIALYRGTEIKSSKLVGNNNGKEYLIQDDLATLEFFRDNWLNYEKGKITLEILSATILNHFWPEETKQMPSLVTEVAKDLRGILNAGVSESMELCS